MNEEKTNMFGEILAGAIINAFLTYLIFSQLLA